MTNTQEILRIEVDLHAYPWHETDPEYPECGPDNLIRMAETYGVLVEFLPDHPHANWAWWYLLTGPRENIVRLLGNEAYGNEEEASEAVDGMHPGCAAGPAGRFDRPDSGDS